MPTPQPPQGAKEKRAGEGLENRKVYTADRDIKCGPHNLKQRIKSNSKGTKAHLNTWWVFMATSFITARGGRDSLPASGSMYTQVSHTHIPEYYSISKALKYVRVEPLKVYPMPVLLLLINNNNNHFKDLFYS